MTFDSAKQTASALGFSVEYLYSAKNLGCPNFRNNRVHPPELIDWLEKNRREVSQDASERNYWFEFPALNKRMLERARKKLSKFETSVAPAPVVDVLAGLEEKLVRLTAEQAAAIVADLRVKLKAA